MKTKDKLDRAEDGKRDAVSSAASEDTRRLDWMANIGEFEQQLSVAGEIHEAQFLLPEYEEPFVGYGPDWGSAYRAAIDAAMSAALSDQHHPKVAGMDQLKGVRGAQEPKP